MPGVLRGIPGANIDGAGSLAWRASASFSANGQRAARQQLHARRRRQQRDLAADRRHLPERRRARRVQAADRDLLGRVRPVARRRRQPADQVGHQHAATAAPSSSTATTRSTPTTSSTTAPAAPSPTSSRTSSAARSAARSSRTRRSSSSTTRGYRDQRRGRRYLSTVPSLAMRAGDFSELNRVIYDPLTGQPFPGNVIPAQPLRPGVGEHPRRSSIRSRTPPARAAPTGRPSTTT